MKKNNKLVFNSITKIFLLLIIQTSFVFSQVDQQIIDQLFTMSFEELLNVKVISSTKRPIEVRKAPAIATVISSDTIKRMGARSIIDVLETIPGFGITRGYFSLWEIEVRGLKTARSEKIKLMIDGHTMNYPIWGGAAWAYDSISLDNVKQIEILRGPGSALYGSNALSGIINVVTKFGSDIDGSVISTGGGSFNTKRINFMHGKKYEDIDILASLTYGDNNTADLSVKSDLVGQSGHTEDWAENYDASLKLSWNDFILNTKYLRRRNGAYVGVTNVLNDESEIEVDQYMIDFSYNKAISEKLFFNSKIYFNHLDMTLNWEIFSEGVPFMLGFGVLGWPSDASMFGFPSMKNKRYGIETGFNYNLTDNNVATIGLFYERVKHYDLEQTGNFHPLTNQYLGTIQEVFNLGMWGLPAKRTIKGIYLQDEWEVITDIMITLGVRYDDYNDFGDITNPRAGLVWNFTDNSEIKLLYGKAFRAPNFEELYLINNPATLGNPNLEPETINTYELEFGYRLKNGLKFNVTGFHNSFEDRIELLSAPGGLSVFQNSGDATIYGFETEIGYKLKDVSIYTNHTFQRSKSDETKKRIPDVPSNRANLGVDYQISNKVKGNINLLYVGERPRASNDLRSDMEAYTVINATMIIVNIFDNFEIRCSIYNLFDEDYAYPAPPFTLSDDYPAPGRNYFIEATCSF